MAIYVFWTIKCPCSLSIIYKQGFWGLTKHLYSYLPKQYLDLLKQYKGLPRSYKESITMSSSLQVVCLTN